MSSSESKRSPQDNQHHQNLSIDELLPNLYDWDENLVAIADPFDIALEGLNTTTTTTTTERVDTPSGWKRDDHLEAKRGGQTLWTSAET